VADQPKKPYVKLINREPQGTPYNYKDLCKTAALTDEQVETIVNNSSTTINNYITGGLTSPVAIADGGTGQITQTEGFDALAPTTTKGDLIVHNGTDNVRRAVGANDTVLIADSAQATGVKWATAGIASGGTGQVTKAPAFDALAPTTAKGDLIVHDGSNNVRVGVGTNYDILMADSTDTQGVQWYDLRNHPYFYSYPGFAMFGDGIDGDVTISSNTTITQVNFRAIKRYNNLTIDGGFSLRGDASSIVTMIFVKGTLTIGSGSTIQGRAGSFGVGGVGGNGGGSGGAGGNSNSSLQLFARSVIGPGDGGAATIGAYGGPGVSGANATIPTGSTAGASGGGLPGSVNATIMFGDQLNLTSPGVGQPASTAATIAGPIGSSPQITAYQDIETHIFLDAWAINGTNGSLKFHYSHGGVGGASGHAVTSGVGGTTGSSGAASGGWFKAGSNGGGGGTSGSTGGNKSGGGGGGSGAPGNYARIVFAREDSSCSRITLSCNGGNGGNGGNSYAPGPGSHGGGGGGAGGPGGVLFYCGPGLVGSVTAAGGALGTGGTGSIDAGNGQSGVAGTAGLAIPLRTNS